MEDLQAVEGNLIEDVKAMDGALDFILLQKRTHLTRETFKRKKMLLDL